MVALMDKQNIAVQMLVANRRKRVPVRGLKSAGSPVDDVVHTHAPRSASKVRFS